MQSLSDVPFWSERVLNYSSSTRGRSLSGMLTSSPGAMSSITFSASWCYTAAT